MKKILTLGLVCLSLLGSAQEVFWGSNGILEYTVTDARKRTVSVRAKPWHYTDSFYGISGGCILENSVVNKFDGVSYDVTSIQPDAFFGDNVE